MKKIALTIANVMEMQNFTILWGRFVISVVAEIMYTNLSFTHSLMELSPS
jgi:hypothetical protein